MGTKKPKRRYGISRDRAFREWWEADGRFLCMRIIENPDGDSAKTEKKLMEFGFIWGWQERAKRDRRAVSAGVDRG